MNSSLPVRLGYGEWVYPYFYRPLDFDEPTGFLAELWEHLAPTGVYIQYPYEEGEEFPCDGILKEVYDGEILSAADTSTLTLGRATAFRSSLPAYYTTNIIAEAERSLEEHSVTLTFFTVFTIPVFLFVVVLTLLSHLIKKFRTMRKNKVGLDNLNFVSKLLGSIGFAYIFFFYVASFNSNTMTESLLELIKDLKSGKRSFLFSAPDVLDDFERIELFGNVSYSESVEPDVMKLLQAVCDDRSKLTIVESQILQLTHLLERPCRLRSIALPENKPPRFRKIGLVYLFSYETTRKIVERVDQALLRIFQRERVETFWTRRYARSLKFFRAEADENVVADYLPMSLLRLRIILIVSACGCLLSIVTFIVEIVAFHLFRFKRMNY